MANLWNLEPFKPRHDIARPGETIPDMFWNAVQARGDKIIMRQKDFGIWRAWTWREVGTIVRELTMGLVA